MSIKFFSLKLYRTAKIDFLIFWTLDWATTSSTFIQPWGVIQSLTFQRLKGRTLMALLSFILVKFWLIFGLMGLAICWQNSALKIKTTTKTTFSSRIHYLQVCCSCNARERERGRECVCVCVCVREREREREKKKIFLAQKQKWEKD